ncbi:uncharacterized protein [Lepeophtheirus salmonis]|uniref:uncharacterized protein n=1 Tax=Lepeophtheirus salmonis TaxID=72036 RepID=UPI001AE2A65B|nr:uncharacterized protein LOC121115806 [Lepeophtheirus salmonis]
MASLAAEETSSLEKSGKLPCVALCKVEEKEVHPHMLDLVSRRSSPLPLVFSYSQVESNIMYYIAQNKHSPYVILFSQGEQSYLLLIPERSVSLLPPPGPSWAHLSLYYPKKTLKLCSLLLGNKEVEAHVPFNLDDFLGCVVNKRLIFLPQLKIKDLCHSNRLITGKPLISHVVSKNGLQVYDIDLNKRPIHVHLFHHLNDVSCVLKMSTRKKTLRHLRLFFLHFNYNLNTKKLESIIYHKSKGIEIKYIQAFLNVMKEIIRKSKGIVKFNLPSLTLINDPSQSIESNEQKLDNICSITKCPNEKPPSPSQSATSPPSVNYLDCDVPIASGRFFCPKCYGLKISYESIIDHLIQVEYKNELRAYVSSFYSSTQNKCVRSGCSKELSEEEMIQHIGLDHEVVIELFLKESKDAIKPCLIKDCSFVTLGIESVINHMIFIHYYENINQEIQWIQKSNSLSANQCPFYECQDFVMQDQLFLHYALEHGAYAHFMKRPWINDIELLAHYYEYMFFGHIKNKFRPRFVCDLLLCHNGLYFYNYWSYLLHLGISHYQDKLKYEMGKNRAGKCSYNVCGFSSSDTRVLQLHIGIYHNIILRIDSDLKKKHQKRFNNTLLKMYDNIWKFSDRQVFACDTQCFKTVTSLFKYLQEKSGGSVGCLICSCSFPVSPDSHKFYDHLLYHILSKEHIFNAHNYHDNPELQRFPISSSICNCCLVCDEEVNETHHLLETHHENVSNLGKFVQYCFLRHVNPITCSILEMSRFLEYLYRIETFVDEERTLMILCRLHEKGDGIKRDETILKTLSSISDYNCSRTPNLYTCFACPYFAGSYNEIKTHIDDPIHKKNVKGNRKRNFTKDFLKCEICHLYFFNSFSFIEIHRHCKFHLKHEFRVTKEHNLFPGKKKITRKEVYQCYICAIELKDTQIVEFHIQSVNHIELRKIADAYYLHCSELSISPVTCELKHLKSFLALYTSVNEHRKVCNLLKRIHSGVDLLKIYLDHNNCHDKEISNDLISIED